MKITTCKKGKKGRPKLSIVEKGINKKTRARRSGKKISFTKAERLFAKKTLMNPKRKSIYLR